MLWEIVSSVETVSTGLNLLVQPRQIHLSHTSEGQGLLELMISVPTPQALIEQSKTFTWNGNGKARRRYTANGFWVFVLTLPNDDQLEYHRYNRALILRLI